jgi:hypothetical protein
VHKNPLTNTVTNIIPERATGKKKKKNTLRKQWESAATMKFKKFNIELDKG